MKVSIKLNLQTIRPFLTKTLLLIQFGVIISIPDLLLYFYLAQRFGKFTVIAVVIATSLLGLFVITNSLSSLMRNIRHKFARGVPPYQELSALVLLLVSGYLLISPGLIGSSVGALLYYTPLRIGIRNVIRNKYEPLLLTFYYYLKI